MIQPNVDRISESNENWRKQTIRTTVMMFEAAIGNSGKFGKMIIFRGALIQYFKK